MERRWRHKLLAEERFRALNSLLYSDLEFWHFRAGISELLAPSYDPGLITVPGWCIILLLSRHCFQKNAFKYVARL